MELIPTMIIYIFLFNSSILLMLIILTKFEISKVKVKIAVHNSWYSTWKYQTRTLFFGVSCHFKTFFNWFQIVHTIKSKRNLKNFVDNFETKSCISKGKVHLMYIRFELNIWYQIPKINCNTDQIIKSFAKLPQLKFYSGIL